MKPPFEVGDRVRRTNGSLPWIKNGDTAIVAELFMKGDQWKMKAEGAPDDCSAFCKNMELVGKLSEKRKPAKGDTVRVVKEGGNRKVGYNCTVFLVTDDNIVHFEEGGRCSGEWFTSHYVIELEAAPQAAETTTGEEVPMPEFELKFEEVKHTKLNGVKTDNFTEDDLVALITGGYEEVKRLNKLASASNCEALRKRADALTDKVIRVGKVLTTLCEKKEAEAAKAE